MKERKRPLYVYKEKTAHVFKYYILKLKKMKVQLSKMNLKNNTGKMNYKVLKCGSQNDSIIIHTGYNISYFTCNSDSSYHFFK